MYKKILMPVDIFEMDLSDKAIAHADFLAGAEDATIHMLHVFPKSHRAALRGFAADVKQSEAFISRDAILKMQRLSKGFKTCSSRIYHEVRFGSVRDEVNRLAEALEADVVVIGSRSPTGFSSHLLGSTAENVIRHARIPVFVIR
ncbi:universal stress protein UspG [Shimwellia pseudoproteus]|uniref:universal stress protein n=1 Tax=Shimwellia pseudoproteus TaxID=570012 RepID=UPI0018EA4ABE|nr:universal stress protein [Shimwellia pseudoproteus]MBJ3816878.1 universal stress protein UspG [Shimwellia pseudoproteus]